MRHRRDELHLAQRWITPGVETLKLIPIRWVTPGVETSADKMGYTWRRDLETGTDTDKIGYTWRRDLEVDTNKMGYTWRRDLET